METSNDNICKLLEMLDNPAAYSKEEIHDIINCDDDTREVYRLMVEAKRSSRRKLSCQPIDIDAKWAKFEREVIGKKSRSRKPLFWSVAIAASVLLLTGFFLFAPNSKEPRQLQADAGQKAISKTEKQITAKAEEETRKSEGEKIVQKTEVRHPKITLQGQREEKNTDKEVVLHVAERVVLESDDVKDESKKSQEQPIKQHETNRLAEVVFVGLDSVGNLVSITNYEDGKRLAEQLSIHTDSASEAWQKKHQRIAFYYKEKARLLKPRNMAFGMSCERSQANEWILYYDSIAHALIYKEAKKNIWQATNEALFKWKKIDKERYKSVLRKHPKKCKGIKVKTYSIPITDRQAQELKSMWLDVVSCGKKKAFLQSDMKYEFPLGELKVTAPNAKNPFVSFTNELSEAVMKGNVSHKDSMLTEPMIKKCLTDTKEAIQHTK